MVFSNGYETPLFGTSRHGDPGIVMKSVDIDLTKKIKEIAVNVDKKALYGLRLIDSNGDIIIETTWETF